MRNMWRLFSYDIKHLFCNVITVVIVLGLVFLPSIFTWYNVIACWDVFDNTGNLKVAVANNDEGYKSDLIALTINVGNTVESTLRENDQLDWVFTNEEDAIDGARSGEYYAAVVIPSDFSRDLFSFYSEDTEHAQIIYYTNEKSNAIAPRVTDQGADQVSAQINEAFTETMSDVMLALADSVGKYAEEDDAGGQIATLSDAITSSAVDMNTTADLIDSYADLVVAAQDLVDSSSNLLGSADDAVSGVESAAQEGKQSASEVASTLQNAVRQLENAINSLSISPDDVNSAIDKGFDAASNASTEATDALTKQADSIDTQIETCEKLASALSNLEGVGSEEAQATLTSVIKLLNNTSESLKDLQEDLRDVASDVQSGTTASNEKKDEIKGKVADAQQSLTDLKADYENDLKAKLNELSNTVSDAVQAVSLNTQTLKDVSSDLQGSANSVSGKLGRAQSKIKQSADDLRSSAEKLNDLSQKIDEALVSGSVEQLKEVIGSDPSALASAVSAPVGVERVAVFPVENFGSALAPLYTTLALWVGALLTMVLINPKVSTKAQERLNNPRSWQLFFGRYGVILVVALMQSTVLALGNAFFLHVQIDSYGLFFLTYWAAALVFSFIVYTLVSLFANLGKALAVLLLIIYVTGGGGSFPLQLLPGFIQNISPFLPATHVINCMRCAMMGVYNNDFWLQLGWLLLFLVPCVVLGFMRPLVAKLVDFFVERVERSKLVS